MAIRDVLRHKCFQGIGFLGAEQLSKVTEVIHGLTTAACIWVMAVIGLAVGAGMYIPAAIATVITLFILVSLERLEKRMFLNGVNKILAITCSTATPDLKWLSGRYWKVKAFLS